MAQAIWRVKQTRTAEEFKRFVRKFCLFTITNQDMAFDNRMNLAYSSHQWLRQEFCDDLQFIWDEGAWQEQCDLGKRNWQRHKDEIQGRGALGSEYPTYKYGVEGDTPSFLYVIFKWWQQPEIGGVTLAIEDAGQSKATVRVPANAKGKEFHVICEVHDNGPFHLVAYRRVIIHVK